MSRTIINNKIQNGSGIRSFVKKLFKRKTKKKDFKILPAPTTPSKPITYEITTESIQNEFNKNKIKKEIIKHILLGKYFTDNKHTDLKLKLSIEDIHVLNAFFGLIHDSEKISSFFSSSLLSQTSLASERKEKGLYTKMKVIENLKKFNDIKTDISKHYNPYSLYLKEKSIQTTISQITENFLPKFTKVLGPDNIKFYFEDYDSLKQDLETINQNIKYKYGRETVYGNEFVEGINKFYIKKYLTYFKNIGIQLPQYLGNNNRTKRMVNHVRKMLEKKQNITVLTELYLYDALKTIIWNILQTYSEKKVHFNKSTKIARVKKNTSASGTAKAVKTATQVATKTNASKTEKAAKKHQEVSVLTQSSEKLPKAHEIPIKTPSSNVTSTAITLTDYLPTYTLENLLTSTYLPTYTLLSAESTI